MLWGFHSLVFVLVDFVSVLPPRGLIICVPHLLFPLFFDLSEFLASILFPLLCRSPLLYSAQWLWGTTWARRRAKSGTPWCQHPHQQRVQHRGPRGPGAFSGLRCGHCRRSSAACGRGHLDPSRGNNCFIGVSKQIHWITRWFDFFSFFFFVFFFFWIFFLIFSFFFLYSSEWDTPQLSHQLSASIHLYPELYACVHVCSVVSDSTTSWTVACQAPLSMEFFRQEYWSGLPFPSLGSL